MPFEPTPEQKRVIDHAVPGHGRVLAGPGTGKSATAVALAKRLLEEPNPSKLRFLTFTRAATAELASKLLDAGAAQAGRPSTVHSFALSVLLKNPGSALYPTPLRIPDRYEYGTLIRPHLATQCGVKVTDLDEVVKEMSANWQSLRQEESPRVTPAQRAKFLGVWREHRQIFGYTLLDEIPYLLRRALENHPDLESADYDLLIVDEYQDLNACELEILHRLVDRGASLLAIGDDDQSIYSMRKADPIGITRFLDEYTTDRDYPLTICHRSPRILIEWAQHVIRQDTSRQERPAPTCNNTASGLAALLRFPGERSEAQGIADLITWLNQVRDVPFSEILILYRSDHNGMFTRPIREELTRRGIPIADPNETEEILWEPENRRPLALLRLKINPADSLAWWSLLRLEGGFGPTFIDYLVSKARATNSSFGKTWLAEAAARFADCPSRALSNRAVLLWERASRTLEALTVPDEPDDISWGAWIIERTTAGELPRGSASFERLLTRLDEVSEPGQTVDRFLSQIEPLSRDLARAKANGVRLMSMTGSKGLTVRATIIAGVDNDLIPHRNGHRAEEIRLLYVAMTRSQEFLFLTWTGTRRGPSARTGTPNTGRRNPTEFLEDGPVPSQDGQVFIQRLPRER